MNKITIPALLLGVVMIAGAFAFMPVQEASTVHTGATTILGTNGLSVAAVVDNSIDAGALAADAATEIATAVALETMTPFRVSTAAVATAGGELTATFTCTAGQTCVIYDAKVVITAAANATGDIFHIETVTVAGQNLTGADLAAPTNNSYIVAASGTTIGIAADMIVTTAFATNIPTSVLQTVAAVSGAAAGATPVTLLGGETMTVVVQSSSGDTATSKTIFYGSMTGTTVPATPGLA